MPAKHQSSSAAPHRCHSGSTASMYKNTVSPAPLTFHGAFGSNICIYVGSEMCRTCCPTGGDAAKPGFGRLSARARYRRSTYQNPKQHPVSRLHHAPRLPIAKSKPERPFSGTQLFDLNPRPHFLLFSRSYLQRNSSVAGLSPQKTEISCPQPRAFHRMVF